MIIYLVVNKINGKKYVGQTIRNINQRISRHLCSKRGFFPKALRKYGLQSFEISVIDSATSHEELNEKEVYWIKFYNCKAPLGYNLTEGGEGNLGHPLSEDSKKKISKAHKGKQVSDETRERMSNSQRKRYGKTHNMPFKLRRTDQPKRPVGRPRKEGGAFSNAERQRRHRERVKKDKVRRYKNYYTL